MWDLEILADFVFVAAGASVFHKYMSSLYIEFYKNESISMNIL